MSEQAGGSTLTRIILVVTRIFLVVTRIFQMKQISANALFFVGESIPDMVYLTGIQQDFSLLITRIILVEQGFSLTLLDLRISLL